MTMNNSQDSVQNYSVALTLDPKVMQWFASRGNDNFIFTLYLTGLNYPPTEPQAIGRFRKFITTPAGGIRTSRQYHGDNATGHFSSTVTLVADPACSAITFGSVSPNVTNVSFEVRTMNPTDYQTKLAVCLGLSPSDRIPTNDPVANSMITIQNGECNGFQGTGTIGTCPLPLTGFKGSVQRK
jgi:hypothetical protein